MRRTLACLLLLAFLAPAAVLLAPAAVALAPAAVLLAPAAEAKSDAWPYLVRACQRIKEGRLSLDLAQGSKSAAQRRQHAQNAISKFDDATSEAAMGLQVADKTLKDGLFDAWNDAKKLAAKAKPLAAAKKKKKAKKKKARPADDDEPQTSSGSYGIVACSRINARRRAIGAPPICRRGLSRR